MSSLVLVVMHISLDKAAQLINWTFCFHGEHKEVQENGTLGQLVRVRLGMRQGGWGGGGGRSWGNSSGCCIPVEHQTISGATKAGTKQELIRRAGATKKVTLAAVWGKRGRKWQIGEGSVKGSEILNSNNWT